MDSCSKISCSLRPASRMLRATTGEPAPATTAAYDTAKAGARR